MISIALGRQRGEEPARAAQRDASAGKRREGEMEGWVKRRAQHLWRWHSRYLVLNPSAASLLYYSKAGRGRVGERVRVCERERVEGEGQRKTH